MDRDDHIVIILASSHEVYYVFIMLLSSRIDKGQVTGKKSTEKQLDNFKNIPN